MWRCLLSRLIEIWLFDAFSVIDKNYHKSWAYTMLMKTDWQKSMFFFIEYYDFSTILGMCSLNNSPPSNRVPIFRGNYKPGKSTNFKINYQYHFYFYTEGVPFKSLLSMSICECLFNWFINWSFYYIVYQTVWNEKFIPKTVKPEHNY